MTSVKSPKDCLIFGLFSSGIHPLQSLSIFHLEIVPPCLSTYGIAFLEPYDDCAVEVTPTGQLLLFLYFLSSHDSQQWHKTNLQLQFSWL
jgi:hypothetical protein